MLKKLDLTDVETAQQVLALQKASYKIEVQLIGFEEIPPLKETLPALQASGETFHGYFADGLLAGIISYKVEDRVLDIHRVAVHPRFFRRGIAGTLIDYAEKAEENIKSMVVCTGRENLPAVSLYRKKGFQKKRDMEIGRGIYLTEFEKLL